MVRRWNANSNAKTTSICAWMFLAVFCVALGQGSALAKKQPPAKPIDINAATGKELEELPGVGPTTAKAIILFRTRSGRFRRVEDLLAVRGISETKLKNMRRYITLGVPPAKKAP
jgi:competence ComEA-like helix-hairpin-helix protein